MPSFQPYWGKPAVRNDRGDRGDVGIIRSPVRASILPDWGQKPAMAALPDEAARTDLYGGCSVISIPTAIVQSYAILPIGWPMGRFGPLGRGLLKDVVFQDHWGKPYRGFNRTESCRLSGLAGTDSSKSGFLQRRVGRTSPIRPAAPAIEIEFAGKARVRIRTSSLPATAFELSSGPFTVKQKKLATARLHEALGTTPRQLSADPMRTDRRSGGRCRTRKGTRSDLVRCHRDPLNRAAA